MESTWYKSKLFLVTLAAAWFIAVGVPIAYLMGSHQAFNPIISDHQLSPFIKDENSVLHLISADCQCSIKVADHLASRGPLKSTPEKILFFGENQQISDKLLKAGFQIEFMLANSAEKLKMNALPQLIVFGAQKKLLYAGGYSSKRSPASAEDYEDLKIISQSFSSKSTSESLPVFGCAFGKQFQKIMDPLGLKY